MAELRLESPDTGQERVGGDAFPRPGPGGGLVEATDHVVQCGGGHVESVGEPGGDAGIAVDARHRLRPAAGPADAVACGGERLTGARLGLVVGVGRGPGEHADLVD